MHIHAVLRNTALVASVVISLKSLEALLVPVWAIVAICATLPAMVVLTSMVLPKACAAAIEIRAIFASHAGKWLAAVLAGEGCSLADMQTLFFGDALALADLATKPLLGTGLPVRTILGKELFPAEVASSWYKSSCLLSCFILALTRTASAIMTRYVLKLLTANRACVSNAGSTPLATSANMSAFGRTIEIVWTSITVRARGVGFPANRAGSIKQLRLDLSGIVGVTASNRTELSWFERGKVLTANRANRLHQHTSGSMIRAMLGARSPERTLVSG